MKFENDNVFLICGGRDFSDQRLLNEVLEKRYSIISAIVHGDCAGADRMAGEWARSKGIAEIKVPAQWDEYGKKAGPIRNVWMLRFIEIDYVIAFPGGSGTQNMINLARKQNIEVIIITYKRVAVER